MSWHNKGAVIILALYLALGVLYGAVNPLFESPDELMHYPYVKQLADGGGLPVQGADSEALWEQEGSQPPLYYALSAALTHWIDTDDLLELRQLNPHAQVGIPLAPGNKNVLIHTAREAFPWQGSVLAVHLIRLFSLLLGAGTVACTYLLARHVVPDRPEIALGAMAVNAFIPQFLFISSSVNNDNLITLLASVTVLLLVRLVGARGEVTARQNGAATELSEVRATLPARQLLLLGTIIGLACLSKLSGLALVPLAGLALALRRVRLAQGATAPSATLGTAAATTSASLSQPAAPARVPFARHAAGWGRGFAREFALVLGPVLLVAGWWYLRNWRLYNDPLGTGAMVAMMGSRTDAPTLAELIGEFRGLRMSFWGIFGWFNVLMRPTWLYWLLDALTLAALAGLGVGLFRAGRETLRRIWPTYALLLAWIGALAVALLRWTMTTRASQGRLLFPGISVLSLLLVLGLAGWLSTRHSRRVLAGIGGLLALLSLVAPLAFIRPAYAPPPLLTLDEIPSTARGFEVDYGDSIRLVAYEMEQTSVRPGETIGVTLYWQALKPMERNYSVYAHLFGRADEPVGQLNTYPGGGNYPTSQWVPGQVIRDRIEVPVSDDPLGPTAARVQVGVYDLETMENLPATDNQGQQVGRPILARVKLAVPTNPVTPPRKVDANLDNRVRLAGYMLDEKALRPGTSVPIVLYWEVTDSLPRDYTVFVHLVNENGEMAGQGDGPPLNDDYPTSFWGAGETLADLHHLWVLQDARPGPHRLLVGLYDPETGQRLALLDAGGAVIGDAIELGPMEVQPSAPAEVDDANC
ncbi:MAG: phospholipid carrier-dependent glycosyltransferase [Chloroflexi bacterium]|nr:phospholipid carrier-dependent glycosyltransferase [Chloroflexota bacterium]